jgi:hypothetical protein
MIKAISSATLIEHFHQLNRETNLTISLSDFHSLASTAATAAPP